MAAVAYPLRPRLSFGRLRFHDRRAALLLVGIVLAYGLIVGKIAGVSLREQSATVFEYEPVALVTMLVVGIPTGIAWWLRPESRFDIKTRIFWLIVSATIAWLLIPFFGTFKQLILPNRGFLWDRTFAHLGRALFGVSPWVITHEVFGSVKGARALDFLYSIWLPLAFTFPQLTAALVPDPRTRFRLIFTWVAAWILIATVAAWLLSSAGPVYFNSLIGPDPSYALLQERLSHLARMAASQGEAITTLQYQPILLQVFREHDDLRVAGGISAMPSMHVALATLIGIAGFQRNRAWGFVLSSYAFLIWIGSIFFGWHYFVDGPVAALMILAIWKASAPLACLMYPGRSAMTPLAQGLGASGSTGGIVGDIGVPLAT